MKHKNTKISIGENHRGSIELKINNENFGLEYKILENKIVCDWRKNPSQKFELEKLGILLFVLKKYFLEKYGVEIIFDTKKIKQNFGKVGNTNSLIFSIDIK